MGLQIAMLALTLAALALVGWALRIVDRQQRQSHQTIESLVDHVRSRDAFDAASATATREAGRQPPAKEKLEGEVVPPLEPTGLMGNLKAGRQAMRAKGYDPDKPEDVDAWEKALGPSPFGGGDR